MAENVDLNPGVGGDTIAADEIAGVKHQRVKVQFGGDGSATDVSVTDPFPVFLDSDDSVFTHFEDTDFGSGDSPATLDVDAALTVPARSYVVVCDGPGSILVASTNGTGGSPAYSPDVTLNEGEKLRVDGLQTDRIRITHSGADSGYRVVASLGSSVDIEAKTSRGVTQLTTGIDASTGTSTGSVDLRGMTHVQFGATLTADTWSTAVLTLEVSTDDSTWLPSPLTLTGAADVDQVTAAVPVGMRYARVTVTTVEGGASTLTVQVGASV